MLHFNTLLRGTTRLIRHCRLVPMLLLALVATTAQAQILYTRTVLSGLTYTPVTGGGITVINSNAGLTAGVMTANQDDGAAVVTLPFTFTYNGNTFTQATFCTNGWLGMGSQGTVSAIDGRAPGNLWTTVAPNNTIAAWFADGGANFPATQPGTGPGQMRHGLVGTGIYAFEWSSAVGTGFSVSTVNLINYKIIIYGPASTNPGRIEYHYGSTAGTVATGRTLGIENAVGGTGNYLNALNNTNNTPSTATAWPGNGNGYRFDPLNCTQPNGTTSYVGSCGTNQFFVSLNLTSLGDATSVNLLSNVLGTEFTNVSSLGTYQMGPYTSATTVNITIVHNGDAACNRQISNLVYVCPITSYPSCQSFNTFTTCTTTCPAPACVLPLASGWSNETTEVPAMDWIVDFGTTPSSGSVTGPVSGDNPNGPSTGTGNFLYTESSGCTSRTAIVYSSQFDKSSFLGPIRSTMYYSMRGATIGTLSVDIEDPAFSNNWVTLFTISGAQNAGAWTQTPPMNLATANPIVRYRVRGLTGTSFTSDIAIDDFCTTEGSCTNPTGTATIVNQDCNTLTYGVNVNLTSIGDAPNVDIVASYPVAGTVVHNDVSALQVYNVPGIPIGTPVTITLVHNGNGNCTATLPAVNSTLTCIINNTCGLAQALPDNNCGTGGRNFAIPMTFAGTQLGVDANLLSVDLIASHTWRSDLQIKLTSPNGVTRNLILNRGGSADNFGNNASCPTAYLRLADGNPAISTVSTTVPSVTGSFAPEQSLAGFNDGSNPNGVWTLNICDNVGGDAGTLHFVNLTLGNCVPPTATGTIALDCANSQFTVNVNVTSLGSATSLDISSNQFGVEEAGVGTGLYVLGPYPLLSTATITVIHNGDPVCNLNLGNYTGTGVICNDNCTSATVVTCASSPIAGTTVGAATDVYTNCGAGGASPQTGVWYKYVGDNQAVTASLCGSGFDTRITIFEGSCASLSCGFGNDDFCALQSQIGFNAFLGTDYFIFVHGFSGTGAFTMSLTCAPLCLPIPLNETCATAMAVTVAPAGACTPTPGDNACAAAPVVNPTCFSAFATLPDLWYSFVAPANGKVGITITRSSATQMGYALYSACGGTQLACATTTTSGVGTNFTGLIPGNTYRLQILSTEAQEGSFDLCIQELEYTSICSLAPGIVCGQVKAGSTIGEPNTLPVSACPFPAPASTGGTNWWKYVAASTEDVTASLCNLATYNSRLSIFHAPAGDCSVLDCIRMNDNSPGCASNTSEITFPAVAGQTYYIAVHGSGALNGNYQLSVTCDATCTPVAANDACAGASPIIPVLNDGFGVPTLGDNTCAYNEQHTSCSSTGPVAGVWYSFNSGVNTNMLITLLDVDLDATYTAPALSYALFNGACSSLLALGEVACDATGEGYDQSLPTLTINTDYKLLVYNAGGIGTEGTFGVMLEFPAQNDAGVQSIISPDGLVCSTQIQPEVNLTNYGMVPLSSVDILYSVDGGPQQTFTWTSASPLGFNQTAIVELPLIIVSAGPHTFEATVANPNGQPDEIALNDASSSSFDSSGEEVTIFMVQDRWGAETTWEIYDALEIAPVASGGPYTNLGVNGTVVHTEIVCLPTTFGNCFTLRISDAFGDGMCCLYGAGNWQIRSSTGAVLLTDNFHGSGALVGSAIYDGFDSPALGANPAYTGHEFCLPKGPADIEAADCNVFTNTLTNKVYALQSPGTGNYQFEFSNPDQAYRRRISVPQRYVKFSQLQTSPLVAGTIYFARARRDAADDGYSNDNWGSGCVMALDVSVISGCAQLINDIGSPTHSCGVTKSFGYSDKVWAVPVLGATQYRFRFAGSLDPDGPNGPLTPVVGVRQITQASYVRVLNWASYTLLDGETYNVTVEVFVNGVWSGFCGATCTVTIDNPPAFGGRDVESVIANSDVQLYPNPVRDGNVSLVLNGLLGTEGAVTVDIYDLFGKRVYTREIATEGATELSTVLELGTSLASGVYMVDITMGDRQSVQRLSIE